MCRTARFFLERSRPSLTHRKHQQSKGRSQKVTKRDNGYTIHMSIQSYKANTKGRTPNTCVKYSKQAQVMAAVCLLLCHGSCPHPDKPCGIVEMPGRHTGRDSLCPRHHRVQYVVLVLALLTLYIHHHHPRGKTDSFYIGAVQLKIP